VTVADYPHPSSAGRSANMRANRRTDTKPELALRHALHRLGYRYRKDYRLDLDSGRRVRPDIVFTARKVAVFVDGCFWHACPEHGSKPRANEWYWSPKLIKNVERDRVNDAALILAGWTVVRLWEHVPLDQAIATVVTTLAASRRPEPTPLPAARAGVYGRLWDTMRVFLPSTLPALARALQAGQVSPANQVSPAGQPSPVSPADPAGPGPMRGFAVTPSLREAYFSGDEEELEYAAMTEAARASLRMLAADPAAPPRRVVLAAEIPAENLKWDTGDGEPARVLVGAAVPVKLLAAAHVDEPEAAADVRAAVEALPAADAGDGDAKFAVDGAEGHELAWYATQELPYLAE
jgi:DNA mismatch endonuclease (patch repair protein)